VSLPYGTGTIDAVLFDLDDVLVPFQTPGAWQWAWRPQGPLLGERRVRSAVRRALKAWDRRRWEGLTGRQPPADLPALQAHLLATLTAIAGHPVPEAEAVVRRLLRPAGEVERYPDVAPGLERLRVAGIAVGVVTPLPSESARWLLRRTGIPETLLRATGDSPGPGLPDPTAFRAAAAGLGVPLDRIGYVGDLFWSDVRAASRAGLGSLLLDRHDAWPHVQVGRITELGQLEAAFAAGGSASDADGSGEA
jgi:HAD superfamily hydrolase (TIGR01549 family)